MAPKILLIGNCQVRPIEALLNHLYTIEESQKIIVHLAQNSDRTFHEKLLSSADIIISQQIQDNYPCETVRSSAIKQEHGDRAIFIPNLFYKGYTPDLRYLRIQGQGTLDGPLGDYHSSIILNSWKDGESIENTLKKYRSKQTWKICYQKVADESLAEYKRRELTLDVTMAKFIERNLSQKQLFFTFNHPSKLLIARLAKKIGQRLDLKQRSKNARELGEPLDSFQIPLHSFTKQQLALEFDGPKKFIGNAYGPKQVNQRQEYNLRKLVRLFFNHYDNKKQEIMERGLW